MQLKEESLRGQIALGWIMNLVVLAVMLLFMTIESILRDDNFMSLRIDPGQSIKWMAYLIAYYALMPIYIHGVQSLKPRAFRWVAVGLAVVGFLFFLLHHLAHWHAGQRPDFSSHVLDLVFHLIGLWVIFNSVQWARIPAVAGERRES
ncbi:MAG: hypothetical protein JF614_21745 [Acidobacteria bacterium]|nr:hypothetical protein [Acidobacteriota bacterium]